MTFGSQWSANIYSIEKQGSLAVIFVKSILGSTIEMRVRLGCNVRKLKKKYAIRMNDAFENVRFIFAGKQLSDECALSSCGIKEGATVHQVLRLRGD